jgi:NADH-quinone oxidoreductase subunit M
MRYLSLLLITPLIGAMLIAFLPARLQSLSRPFAILISLITLAIAWSLWGSFDTHSSSMQFSEESLWNPRLGSSYALGIDGISYPMVLLATLLSLISVIASKSIVERVRGYYALILVLEAAMLGVFMAQDWSLFYIFWELTLIPLFFLINRWGGAGRQTASLNFVLYTMGGSVFMLLSLLVIFDVTAGHSFGFADMLAGARELPQQTQVVIFLGLLIGFGVKMPIFPLHGWLPLAHVEAPSPISILLSGILLKMGAYGLIRAADMLPLAMLALQDLLVTIALISLIYGGLLAWRQHDLKAMIAYSSVSHMGVVLLGIATMNQAGLTGALVQMVAHGLVAGALFLLIGLLYERTHTRDINRYSSLVRITPRFAFFTVLALIGAVGMPGTATFIAELHAIIGGFQVWGWLVLVLSLGMLISAAYAIRTVARLFTGPIRSEMRDIEDLRTPELIAASTLIGSLLVVGFYPASITSLMGTSIAQLSQTLAVLP